MSTVRKSYLGKRWALVRLEKNQPRSFGGDLCRVGNCHAARFSLGRTAVIRVGKQITVSSPSGQSIYN